MKIVFFGTPDYVLPVLEALNKKFRGKHGESPIAAVITQAPKPIGRKQILTYSPIDHWAHKRDIPVFYTAEDLLKNDIKADLGIIADYGKIISKEVIDLFPHGILNIHFSLLPKYRGASPVQSAILAGEKEIGVTIFKIDEPLDHGPIISQFKEELKPSATWGDLKAQLFERTKDVLTELIEPYLQGKIKLREQNHEEATYTSLVKKEYGFVPPEYLKAALEGKSLKDEWVIPFIKNFSLVPNPESLERFVRAMNPWPNAWTIIKIGNQEKRLRILKASLKEGKLVLEEVQLEGKTVVSWEEFKRGYPEVNL